MKKKPQTINYTNGDKYHGEIKKDKPHGKGKNIGVDIKHNSYDRYLARKKSQYLKTEQSNNFVPKYGNKTMKFGLVYGSRCKNC